MGLEVKRVFCMELATAGVVFAFLGILGGVYQGAETAYELATFKESPSEATTPNINDDDYDEDALPEKTGLAELILTLIGVVIDILCSVLLMLGTIKKKHPMILPWLFFRGLLLVFLIPTSVLTFFAGIYYAFVGSSIEILLISILVIGVTALFGYVWVGIYSLYKSLRSDQNKPIPIAGLRLYPDIPHMQFKS